MSWLKSFRKWRNRRAVDAHIRYLRKGLALEVEKILNGELNLKEYKYMSCGYCPEPIHPPGGYNSVIIGKGESL